MPELRPPEPSSVDASVDVVDASSDREAHEELTHLVRSRDLDAIATFVRLLPPEDTPYTISHLDEEDRTRFFELLTAADADLAADLLEHFDDGHAADMVSELEPETAAVLVDAMDSDEQADVLGELDDHEAHAILEAMAPEDAADLRERIAYDEHTAGGLMIVEYLAYPDAETVETVVADLRENHERYNEYEVRYLYTLDDAGKLTGAVPMRRLVMSGPGTPLQDLRIVEPVTVRVDTPDDELEDLFDRVDYSAVPVLDGEKKMVGVVQRAAVQEHRGQVAEEDLAKARGIVGGEELRTMPAGNRAFRRLIFLLPIMGLTMISASVIAFYEQTIAEAPNLAKFLPVVAGLCGSSGGQAVAVSMREISLGLIRVGDVKWVITKELASAAIVGLVIGTFLFVAGWVWDGHWEMGMVVGLSAPLVMLFATAVGGSVPVVLKGVGLDPAMISGPAVQTVIDLVSFFTVLTLATLLLASIV
ncbi:MAG: magnesium transporter [Planctomycetota bacterium]